MHVIPVHIRREGFDPVAELAEIRESRPVTRLRLPTGAHVWLVTSYEHVREVLSDADRFGSDGRTLADPAQGGFSVAASGPLVRHGDLSVYDPPEHGRLRRMIAPAFSTRQVRTLRPRIEEHIAELVDAMVAAGPTADLVESFALPVPAMVICELLGVPYEDRTAFNERTVARFDSARDPVARGDATRESLAYMAELVSRQRTDPDHGILGTLVREHGTAIDDRELAGVGDLLLVTGHETTTNMLALGTLLLLRHPEQSASVGAGENVDHIVEEMLRYLSVAQSSLPRVARADVVLGGKRIRRGERLLCSLPSANRDANWVSDGERFMPSRQAKGHLAFGHGIHYCIGAALARLEMGVAFPALFRRLPTLRLAVPFEDVVFRPSALIHGVERLPVTW
ncbi:cytochrome P450 [Streptomyces sp. NPDC093970]|uniref:cytochrome P450 n=1 Tax=Streptomyces sp. NPDC093970 TaxID=3155076 RepID=UPI00343F04B7